MDLFQRVIYSSSDHGWGQIEIQLFVHILVHGLSHDGPFCHPTECPIADHLLSAKRYRDVYCTLILQWFLLICPNILNIQGTTVITTGDKTKKAIWPWGYKIKSPLCNSSDT